ncbi:MBL fold metallo-hydrolase [Brevibacterium litoralis]|uniref:MBL fold metallo-hydrolase n=1 Tax=Brevibacterium litoralis TaxID=3138935 RepID=UPI0032EF5EF3
MQITAARAAFLDVNCYAVAPEVPADHQGPRPCVLVDAGHDAAPALERTLADLGWEPRAILLTHGHLDHVLGLPGFLARWDVPVYIGADDAYRLADPVALTSPQLAAQLGDLATGWTEPAHEPTADHAELEIAGLRIGARTAPGHTEGSTLWRVTDAGEQLGSTPELPEVLFTGDVLFAGAIGRTDLAGGDPAAMDRTLAWITELPDSPVLPGHGPASLLSHEVAHNPYLAGA